MIDACCQRFQFGDRTHDLDCRVERDEQIDDVRAALRVLDESRVPSIDYVTGAELTIAQRVKILASWSRRRGM